MKSGTVAVIGRANAGKSTLVNVIVGEKVAIVSPKPQTTRDRILAVLTTDDYQIVFEDTPGLYKASGRLNSYMQRTAEQTARDVDIVLMVVDIHEGLREEDLATVKRFAESDTPLVVALSKTDIMPEQRIPEALAAFDGIDGIEAVIPISSRRGKNVGRLIKKLYSMLGVLGGDGKIFEDDVISDKSERFMLAEIMREKMLLKYDREIPHGVAVIVNKFEERPNSIVDVDLDIVCEKPNHKAIIIGKQGSALKEVNSFARESMEKFLGKKVFLTVYVRVEENWRDSAALLSEYGYTDR